MGKMYNKDCISIKGRVQMGNKLPKESKSAWLKNQGEEYEKLQQSTNAEVTIVGGGITGVTAAYLLSKAGINTVLVEADKICGGTTGHTTAKISAQHGLIYDQLIQDAGLDKANLYYKANVEAMQLVEQFINEYAIDCDYEKHDAYVYTNDERQLENIKNEAEAYKKIGIVGEITKQMPLDIQFVSALKMTDQAQFHPVKYIQTLAALAKDQGARIYENSPAEDIKPGNKARVILRDNDIEVESDHVIVASHYPFWDKQGLYFAKMEPQRSYVNAVKVPNKYPGGMYITAESPTRSIRQMQDNKHGELWLIGGDSHKTGQGEPEAEHYETLHNYAKKMFNGEQTLYRWSAQDPVTLDKIPYIGPITEGNKNIYIATGYAKWGMTQGTIAAKHITDLIVKGNSPFEELYNPSRKMTGDAFKKTFSYNADTAKHLVKGKFDFQNKDIDELQDDQAGITQLHGQRVGAYKDTKGEVHLVNTTCTHLGCEVNWNSGERSWDCPCHGSRFSYTGEVLEGPAVKPLKTYKPK